MKNKKIIIIVIIVLLVIGGITFGIFNFVESLKKDAEQTKQQMKEIDNLYESLNNNAMLFNDKKTEYDKIMGDIYYTTFPSKNEAILKILKEYDEIISNIQKDGNHLQDKCNAYYNSSDTMQKCTSYKISYESAMTLFIADLNRYNTLVENYNEWTKENTSYKQISTYVSKNVE